MKTALFVVAAALVLGGASLPPVIALDPEPDVFRLVRVYGNHPVAAASCTKTEQEVLCATSVPDEVTFSVPSGLGRVDVTASLTIEYRTTSGDGARLIATLDPPAGPPREMRPRPFALAPATDATTTGMTWVSANRPPSDGAYSFLLEIAGAEGTRSPYRVAVREAVLEITATPG